ncbi:MAG: acyl carrier protein [Solirubrobacteraceae bacterium]
MPATITEDTVEQTIKDVLPQFGIDASQITRDATFEDLDIDSLDVAELSQIIEDEYGIRLSSEELAELKTIDDTIRLVVSRSA